MRRFFLLLFLFYLSFSLTGDFSSLKRNFSPAEEATYLMAQRWEGATPGAINYLRRFYPRGGRVVLTWRGKPQPYSPWIYNALSYPFFRLLGERGLYLLNALLLFLALNLILAAVGRSAFPYLALAGSTLPVFLLLEGPYTLVFFLASLVLCLLSKEKYALANLTGGVLSFLSLPFFFFLPMLAVRGGRRIANLLLGFSSFFLLVLVGLYLPGALPWDIPHMVPLYSSVTSFFTEPILFYSGSFPLLEFFFGRFTGLLLYFPVFLVFLLAGRRNLLYGLLSLSAFLLISPFHAPFGFFGNPWLIAFVPFVLPMVRSFSARSLAALAVLPVFVINVFPIRSGEYPLIFSKQPPFGWGRVEANIVNSIPALRIGENLHLDRNFFYYKGNSLRPRGTDRVEFLRLSPEEQTVFILKDLAGGNRLLLKVNRSVRRLNMKRKGRYAERFQGKELVPGLFLYHVEVKAEECRPILPQKICLGVELQWK